MSKAGMESALLLELPGPKYLSTALSDTSIGFTYDPHEAWRFPSKSTAEFVRKALNGALGAQPIEHGFITEGYEAGSYAHKQDACKSSGTRYYGDAGTIHGSGHIDVETCGQDVVALWFRCQPLPFRQTEVDLRRATEMRRMMSEYKVTLHGVEVKDKK